MRTSESTPRPDVSCATCVHSVFSRANIHRCQTPATRYLAVTSDFGCEHWQALTIEPRTGQTLVFGALPRDPSCLV